MRNFKNTAIVFMSIISLLSSSCKKFLDEKPDQKLAVASSLMDFQAMLDSYAIISRNDVVSGEISADDYYLPEVTWSALSNESFKNKYIWQDDGIYANDWLFAYRIIFTANTVLEGMEKIRQLQNNQRQWQNIMGQAYFWRARSFQQMVFTFSPAYDRDNESSSLGVPLRLNADFNQASVRSAIGQSYLQIIDDCKSAIALLNDVQVHPVRPSRPAALALLARTFLAMRMYDSCYKYANLSLQLNNALLDFNDPRINSSGAFPFSMIEYHNPEILVATNMGNPVALGNTRARIDSTLFSSYETNDLRKSIFFKSNSDGSHSFKGTYTGESVLFTGIATDEVYLMRAECLARAGKSTEAMNDLNKLLNARWKTNTFIPLQASDASEALEIILKERRKELLMRGIRWMDIKRLNMEGRNIILRRFINNQQVMLSPGDYRYALLIPNDVILLSGMIQNPR